MKRPLLLLGLILAAAIAWWWFGASSTRQTGKQPQPPASARSPRDTAKQTAPAPAAAEEPSHLADTLSSPATDIRSDLRVVSEVIEAFRSNFPREGNPVGDNAEITAALTGRNPLGLVLIPPKHRAINPQGELCDRWGTPFFFHALSAHRMEIRSAGPDRRMWSDDDVVFTP